jgi:hypothetical protein
LSIVLQNKKAKGIGQFELLPFLLTHAKATTHNHIFV